MFQFKHHPDGERNDYVRRTRTICIHSDARPGVGSKSVAKVTLRDKKTGQAAEGVFCVDAVGSKIGHVIAHKSHFPFPEGTEVELDIREATASECIEWLKDNGDPERKAFGHILESSLSAENEAKRLNDLSRTNVTIAQNTLDIAKQMHQEAREAAQEARKDKAAGWFIGAAGFIFGALLDFGLIKEQTGFSPSVTIMVILCLIATALLLGAHRLGSRIARKAESKP